VRGSHTTGRIVRLPSAASFSWRLSYTDVVMKFFNAFGIGVAVAAAVLAVIYRREVREMVLPIIRNLW
jgi:hypothetical protein